MNPETKSYNPERDAKERLEILLSNKTTLEAVMAGLGQEKGQ
jgi:hypothetical protein